ncbi:MAG TPA: ChbG/HpnK family deacetylase [Acidimicrobiales bacterium]|nr:ChbG/HpnK family deacetylase [Acidimicrobiales bacterium]
MRLSVVLPCWNEEAVLPASLEAVEEAARAAAAAGEISDWEAVVVDDGSSDATARVAREAADADPHVRLIRHPANRGLGAAVRTGLEAATGDVVLYTDADLPCDLAHDLPRALRLLRIYDAGVVAAYRHDRTAEGVRRTMYSAAYNSLVHLAFGLRLRDVNFAFKLLRREVVDKLSLASEGSFIDVELLVRAERAGFKTIQFGVDYFPRTRGVSTLSSPATIARILGEMSTIGRRLGFRTPGAGPPGRVPADPRRLLVVNADDYGLTEGVARGILDAHHRGIVTSTSMLVLGRGFRRSADWLNGEDRLGVGVHLAAVGEDPPMLGAAEIPTLVDRRGRLPASWRVFLLRLQQGRIDLADVAREFRAQLEAAVAVGPPISHLDTHQHLHLWPGVRDVVVALAGEFGVPAVRVPRSESPVKGPAVNALADRLATAAGHAGLAHPSWAVGLDEAGRMHDRRLEQAVARLCRRAGPAELSCHPGHTDDSIRAYRWDYHWDQEMRALTDDGARRLVEQAGFRLGTYHDLEPAARVAGP